MIEQYFIENGEYPNNLNVVQNDENYFPDGGPICPVTGKRYPATLNANNRVKSDNHLH